MSAPVYRKGPARVMLEPKVVEPRRLTVGWPSAANHQPRLNV